MSEGEIEEGARLLVHTMLGRNGRGAPERRQLVGGRLAARHLTLVNADGLRGLGCQLGQPLQERLYLGGGDAGERLLTVLQRFVDRDVGL